MKAKRLAAAATAGALMMAGMSTISNPAQAAVAAADNSVDFNGDGYDDLAVAAPVENIEANGGVAANAGAISILYGGPNGLEGALPYYVAAGDTLSGIAVLLGTDVATLESLNNLGANATLTVGQRLIAPGQTFDEEMAGVGDISESDDRWGSALAPGDVNGDGYDDIVVGAMNEAVSGQAKTGAITVLFGSAAGITTEGSMWIHQNTPGIPGIGEAGDFWGRSIIVADLNGDAYGDIVVGADGEDIGTQFVNAGAITVIYGSASGPDTGNTKLFFQGFNGTPGALEAQDGFGLYLSATDINGDTYDDIVVGAPFEDIGNLQNAGAITVLYGSAAGVTGTNAEVHWQQRNGVPGLSEQDDKWGRVSTGDINGDGFGDVLVSAPFENLGTLVDGGAASVLYGSANGLTTNGAQLFFQQFQGTPGLLEAGDRWGMSVQVGDLNNDGFDDVIVGAPEEDIGTKDKSGAVTVMYGTANGVNTANNAIYWQDFPGVPGTDQAGDRFGDSLAIGDYDNNGVGDLVVGITSEDSNVNSAGGIVVLPQGGTAGSVLLTQDSANVGGVNELGDSWGQF